MANLDTSGWQKSQLRHQTKAVAAKSCFPPTYSGGKGSQCRDLTLLVPMWFPWGRLPGFCRKPIDLG